MGWHVQFFSPSLGQTLISDEFASENEALEAAWKLAEAGEEVTGIEGPDGEVAGTDEIELWFRENKGGSTDEAPQSDATPSRE